MGLPIISQAFWSIIAGIIFFIMVFILNKKHSKDNDKIDVWEIVVYSCIYSIITFCIMMFNLIL